MRTIHAYCPLNSNDCTQTQLLLPETSHHLAQVLRMKLGDRLQVFDGCGKRFDAEITALGKRLSIKLIQQLTSNTESTLLLTLMIAVGKGDKMDWIIQKATELGVTQIWPLLTARSEVHLSAERWQKKQLHWQEIMINACEQSGRDYLPHLHAVCSLQQGLTDVKSQLKLLLHPETSGQKLKTIIEQAASESVSLLIGPEGGFDSKEVLLAKQYGFRLASLGPRILRMETAAVSSITLLQALLGDI